jgi:hypothetical protein
MNLILGYVVRPRRKALSGAVTSHSLEVIGRPSIKVTLSGLRSTIPPISKAKLAN